MKKTGREKCFSVLLWIVNVLMIPILLMEYFGLFWWWAGDGLFMLISVPTFFVLFLGAQGFVWKKICEKHRVRKRLIYGIAAAATPMMTVWACYALAWIVRYEIVIA